MQYKVIVIGTTDFTYQLLKRIHKKIVPIDLIVTISNDVTKKNHISNYTSLDKYAWENKIELFKAPSYYLNDDVSCEFFRNNSFDLGISAGWQRKIPPNILSAVKYGIYGFHGSCGYLPYGRGRSPFNWSIINGDNRIIQNLFKYDDNFDSPNIFSKKMFEINHHDTIQTIQFKSIIIAVRQIKELYTAYQEEYIPINTESYDFDLWYEKRTPSSGKINFHDKTREIYNLIRATTRPFPGAFAYTAKGKVCIWKAHPFDSIIDFSKYQPGQIIDVINNMPIVRTIDGSLIIKEYEGALLSTRDILY